MILIESCIIRIHLENQSFTYKNIFTHRKQVAASCITILDLPMLKFIIWNMDYFNWKSHIWAWNGESDSKLTKHIKLIEYCITYLKLLTHFFWYLHICLDGHLSIWYYWRIPGYGEWRHCFTHWSIAIYCPVLFCIRDYKVLIFNNERTVYDI